MFLTILVAILKNWSELIYTFKNWYSVAILTRKFLINEAVNCFNIKAR